MRFSDCYAAAAGKRPVFSFELFPPKTEAGMKKIERIVPELIDLGPDFFTVTYGAMGTTREKTLEIARSIKATHDIETACHLTCVGSSREELDRLLDSIHDSGIENIVALRGDPPVGESEFKAVEGGYEHAVDLVRHIRERADNEFGIAVAGYPEKHVEAVDFDTDLAFLKDKVDAGADIVVTQLFYDNAAFFRFEERARTLGIECPIVPGILPILSAQQIRRITSMCGTCIPTELQESLEAAGDDRDATVEIGVSQAVNQVRELLEHGVPGIHFYVLNAAAHMVRVFSELSADLAR